LSDPKWLDGPQQFITVKEAARYMGCSIDLIYDALHRGPPEGIPGKQNFARQFKSWYRIPKKEFLEWAHNYDKKGN
jgi:hypothetical protein